MRCLLRVGCSEEEKCDCRKFVLKTAIGDFSKNYFGRKEMKKDFQSWHTKKAFLHESENRPGFHEREVWWCALGVNVGFEQDGGGRDFLRPVIVFRKFNNEIFLGIPLTNAKKDTEFYFPFNIFQFATTGKEEPRKILSNAILSQVRLIDAARLNHKFGDIVAADFKLLTKKFKALLP